MQWAHKTGYGTLPSKNLAEAGRKAKNLYFDVVRNVPFIKQAYQVDIPNNQILARLRSEFKKQKDVTDIDTIDRLVFIGRTELIDTLNIFKTRSHVMRLLEPDVLKEQYHLIDDKDSLASFFKPQLLDFSDETAPKYTK